jgi:hypothetical protein
MSYALYIDPAKKHVPPELPISNPVLAYWRLIDCNDKQFEAFDPKEYREATFTIAEIHPAQLEKLEFPVNRLSIVQQKSTFRDLSLLKSKLKDIQCDITFNWDKRFAVDYYIKLIRFWVQCGVQHFSFYELTDFAKWQRIQSALREYGFYFYDRYHACKPGYESPYQKHIAGFGSLYAYNGWSRVTYQDKTYTKGPQQKDWETLAPQDQAIERLLFGMADRGGMELAAIKPYITEKGFDNALENGFVTLENGRVIPSDTGLWDTVALLSQLQNN